MKYLKKFFYKYYKRNFIDFFTYGYRGDNFDKVQKLAKTKKKNFGKKNRLKNFFVIRNSPGGGFFSIFFTILINLQFIKNKKLIPIVDLENFHTKYNERLKINKTYNSWEYYFQNFSKFNLNEIYRSKNVFFSNLKIDTRKFVNIKTIKQFRKIIKDQLKINKKIIKIFKKIYKKKFQNHKVVGLHFRGSDMKNTPNHPFPLTFKQVYNIIDELIAKNYDKIFLVTEEKKYVKILQQKYKQKLIFLNSFRTNDNKLFTHYSRKYHRYKLGKEILIEALLLSKCDILVSTKTNVILSALSFSSKPKKIILIDNGVNVPNLFLSKIYWHIKKFLPYKLFGLKNDIKELIV